MATTEQKLNQTKDETHASLAGEIVAIVLLALSVLLALCLFTYNPQDPSLHTASNQTTQNLIGTIGANVASLLFQFIGLTAYLLPAVGLIFAWRTFRGEFLSASAIRVLGFALLLVSFSALLVAFGFSAFFDRSFQSGGLLGAIVARVLTSGLGAVGACILLIALAAVAFLLATKASFAPFVAVVADFLKFVRGKIVALVQNLRAWRERERAAAQARLENRLAAREEETASTTDVLLEPETVPALGEAAQPTSGVFSRVFNTAFGSISSSFRRLQEPPAWVEEVKPDAQKTDATVDNKKVVSESEEIDETGESAENPWMTAKISVKTKELDDDVDSDSDDESLRKIPIEPLKTEESEPEFEPAETVSASGVAIAANAPKNRRLPAPSYTDYNLPSTDFLNAAPPRIHHADDELLNIAKQLTEKCKEFKANGQVMNICPGPVVTTYEYKLDSGIKFNQITKLVDDLCLGLKAESVRIDRIPGKAFVGIEVPNPRRETIFLREVVESRAFRESNSLLTVALGKTVDGLNYVADLAKMPHLLIAGATGAGKSVGVNSLVVSILYKARPDEVKFIMVDPKQVELNLYADIPHLATPIITDPKRASIALKWAVVEMERRYKELASWGVRNLEGYNAEVHRRNFIEEFDENGEPYKNLPFIVIIIDEFADLMMVARGEVEESITRLAQKARAVGIHLVLATQRPSVNVITGLIKANFPSRISFRVSSMHDSRTIIDGSGAEHLLGRGDMLFLPPGTSRLVRVHGAFVDEKEIGKIVEFVKEQGAPDYDTTITQSDEETDGFEDADVERDEVFEQALRICVEMKRASTSVLQRRLRIGYGRAAAILDAMEREGFVGQADGASKPRPVLKKAFEMVSDWDMQENNF
ncbi:MAG TPA: DNA translocase FtsK [Pyrinomonadaceae bacterium]|jgi:S-DNA-T family DNA segregation ATPase FtsK/SpoIIIE